MSFPLMYKIFDYKHNSKLNNILKLLLKTWAHFILLFCLTH